MSKKKVFKSSSEISKNVVVDIAFIKEAYDEACPKWQAKIQDKFPILFEDVMDYKIGNIYLEKEVNEKYIFSLVDYIEKTKTTPLYYVVALISLESGNRYASPTKILDLENITESDIEEITNGDSDLFTLFKTRKK